MIAMAARRKIPLRNVFYMLSYSYRELRRGGKIDLADEDFENAMDLFAGILCRGVASLVRRGLTRDYVGKTEPLAFPRGKFEIAETIRSRSLNYRKIVCSYDEHSEDTPLNRIVKAGMRTLCANDDVDPGRRGKLRLMIDYFGGVSDIDLMAVRWNDIRYRREDEPYRLLIFICRIVADCAFITETSGERGLNEFIDDQLMYELFEVFLGAYYKVEHPNLDVSTQKRIGWDIDGGLGALGAEDARFLPDMRDDIHIEEPGTRSTLIMDAKWYQKPTPEGKYGSERVRSSHLYQILAYVKNFAKTESVDRVSGMLVYPENDHRLMLEYPVGGNFIWVRSVNLDQEFPLIREELEGMLETWQSHAGC